MKGIEPSCAAWEAAVLPLNYTRTRIFDCRFSIADCNPNPRPSKVASVPNGCSVRCPQRTTTQEVAHSLVRWGQRTLQHRTQIITARKSRHRRMDSGFYLRLPLSLPRPDRYQVTTQLRLLPALSARHLNCTDWEVDCRNHRRSR